MVDVCNIFMINHHFIIVSFYISTINSCSYKAKKDPKQQFQWNSLFIKSSFNSLR